MRGRASSLQRGSLELEACTFLLSNQVGFCCECIASGTSTAATAACTSFAVDRHADCTAGACQAGVLHAGPVGPWPHASCTGTLQQQAHPERPWLTQAPPGWAVGTATLWFLAEPEGFDTSCSAHPAWQHRALTAAISAAICTVHALSGQARLAQDHLVAPAGAAWGCSAAPCRLQLPLAQHGGAQAVRRLAWQGLHGAGCGSSAGCSRRAFWRQVLRTRWHPTRTRQPGAPAHVVQTCRQHAWMPGMPDTLQYLPLWQVMDPAAALVAAGRVHRRFSDADLGVPACPSAHAPREYIYQHIYGRAEVRDARRLPGRICTCRCVHVGHACSGTQAGPGRHHCLSMPHLGSTWWPYRAGWSPWPA